MPEVPVSATTPPSISPGWLDSARLGSKVAAKSAWQGTATSLAIHLTILAGAYAGSWAWTGEWHLIPPQSGMNTAAGSDREVIEIQAPMPSASTVELDVANVELAALPVADTMAQKSVVPVARRELPPLQANAVSAEPVLSAVIIVESELAQRQPAANDESTADPSSNVALPRKGHVVRASTVNRSRAEGIKSQVARASAGPAGSSGALSVPSPIYNPRPTYPPGLMAAGVEGLVKLRVELSDEGRVTSAKVVKTSGYDAFDKSALAIIYRWRFTSSTARAPSQRELVVPIRFGIVRN